MKKQFRYGFTLVELLVVISIIGMLAGLLLPAVQAAREAARRATCIANQSQVVLAMLNYEMIMTHYPPMRGVIQGNRTIDFSTGVRPVPSPTGTPRDEGEYREANRVTWVGFILPYIEMNQAWDRLQPGSGRSLDVFQELPIPILKCRSDSLSSRDNSISYVVNGGYQNAYGSDYATASTVVSGEYRFEPGNWQDAVFFDRIAFTEAPTDDGPGPGWTVCRQVVTIDHISSNSGMSYTLLLSENIATLGEKSRDWIEYEPGATKTTAQSEEVIAFCYPFNTHSDLSAPRGIALKKTVPLAGYPMPDDGEDTKSWYGYKQYNGGIAPGEYSPPLFINDPTKLTDISLPQYRRAYPSSRHAGVVVAAFVDRSVRVLSQGMDPKPFVQICQPKCNDIVNQNDLN